MEKTELLEALHDLQRHMRDYWETSDPAEMEALWTQIVAELEVLIERVESS